MFALLTLLVEAARLFVPPGTLPKESRVEIVQIETGWFETRLIGEGEVPDFKSPAGTLVVSVFGPNGASRGFTRLAAKRGEEIAIQAPTSPARGRGQLSLELTFPKDVKPDLKDVALLLGQNEKKFRPDVLVVSGSERARAFWLDVPAGAAAIGLTSNEWTLAKPLNPDVPERGALVLRRELVPKPSLRLRFDVAESVGHGVIEVDLLDCEKQRNFPGPTPIEHCTVVSSQKGRSGTEFVFKNLDPKLFAVRWKLGKWTDTTTEDLENARPTVKTIPIRPFEVSGRVTAAGLPASAKLRFWPVNTALSFETDADEDGLYRIPLVRRGWFVVGIRRPGFESFQADLRLEGDDPRDEHADFDVPVNQIVVTILDAKSGDPVPGAMAFVVDHQHRPSISESADESGLARLPPLKKGSYEVTGIAKGYQRSNPPQTIDVDENTRSLEIEIRLQKSAGIRLRVLDAAGEPLVGALVDAMRGTNRISSGQTDTDGIAVLPDPFPPGQPLVAWDTGGHLGVFHWSGDDLQDLVIPPSAPPILVRFVSPDGQPRSRWATFFAIDGVTYVDNSKRIELVGGDFRSSPGGTFRIGGLPASGTLTIWPFGIPQLAVTRPLPVLEEIVFTVPAR